VLNIVKDKKEDKKKNALGIISHKWKEKSGWEF
jgi:hypothetical protein